MQDYRYYAAALWYQEPLRVERSQRYSKRADAMFVTVSFCVLRLCHVSHPEISEAVMRTVSLSCSELLRLAILMFISSPIIRAAIRAENIRHGISRYSNDVLDSTLMTEEKTKYSEGQKEG